MKRQDLLPLSMVFFSIYLFFPFFFLSLTPSPTLFFPFSFPFLSLFSPFSLPFLSLFSGDNHIDVCSIANEIIGFPVFFSLSKREGEEKRGEEKKYEKRFTAVRYKDVMKDLCFVIICKLGTGIFFSLSFLFFSSLFSLSHPTSPSPPPQPCPPANPTYSFSFSFSFFSFSLSPSLSTSLFYQKRGSSISFLCV